MGSFKVVDFSISVYASTYHEVLTMIEKVKKDNYHGQKFKKCRQEWARGAG